MKTNSVRAALTCAALAFTSAAALAGANPIPGVDVIVKKHPIGNSIAATSDADGRITLKGLTPGDYEITISGKTLIVTMDKLAPAAPAKKESRSSFSLGIGGFLGGGGGSSRSASPVQGAAPAKPAGGSQSGGGGIGIGMNVPLDGGDSKSDGGNAPTITFTATVSPTSSQPTGTVSFLSETPYCRDTAGQGMRMGFTVSGSGPSDVQLSLTATSSVGAAVSGIHLQN